MEFAEKLKVAVVGSRIFNDRKRLYDVLDKNHHRIDMVISGGAKGADSLGREYAESRGLPCLIYYPRWYSLDGEYDKAAGFKRNFLIIKACDVVLAFWDGKSKGTAHSLDLAKELDKKVKIFLFEPKKIEEKA